MARSDYAYFPKLWQKSFLIEIVRKDNGQLHRSFAFSMPPESARFQIPQRVSIKKTFGGHFIDDYGLDSMPIHLKGSTGNSQFKEIYFNQATRYVDGKSEAYLVIQEVLYYKLGLRDFDKYEMRLFDLSSVAEALEGGMLADATSLNANGWRVVLKDGTIERSKDKPFQFNYELEFLAIEPIGIKNPTFTAEYVQPAIEEVLSAVEEAKEKAFSLKAALADYKAFLENIDRLNETLDSIQAEARAFYRTLQGFVDVTTAGINSVFEVLTFPLDLMVDAVVAVRDVKTSFEQLFQSFVDGINNIIEKATKIASVIEDIFGLESAVANMNVAAKSAGALPEFHLVPEGTPGSFEALNEDGSASGYSYILTYGYNEIIATSETRLDDLSMRVYGNPDYADMIAKYNGITGDDDIIPGMLIKVPYLAYTSALQDSEVYAFGTEPYGTDIALAGDGDLQLAEYNDYAVISGLANIGQAIVLRISEDQGSRVRLEVYGIKQSRGSFDPFSLAVLITSVRDTLIRDSRIQSAYGFSLRQDSDMMAMSFEVVLETGATAQYSISV